MGKPDAEGSALLICPDHAATDAPSTPEHPLLGVTTNGADRQLNKKRTETLTSSRIAGHSRPGTLAVGAREVGSNAPGDGSELCAPSPSSEKHPMQERALPVRLLPARWKNGGCCDTRGKRTCTRQWQSCPQALVAP